MQAKLMQPKGYTTGRRDAAIYCGREDSASQIAEDPEGHLTIADG